MVKAKKADAKLARTTTKGGGRHTKNNPFEIHTNRKKHDILGRKVKHERGLPGISRSKAIKKRQKTLLVEYKQKNKANLFIDRRFGEYDETMSLEEKMMRRFTMERKHQHESQSKYRLEDEELTHLGQSLGEINKFEDVQLSDDDDDYNDINDGAEDVKELHFGGFLTKKNPDGKPSDSNEDKPRSRKEIMEEVVAKAKMKKYERQKVKEEAVAMTNKLNQDWRSVMKLLPQKACNRLESEKELAKEEQERLEKLEGLNSHETSSSKADDYDIIVRQLAFEAKATPCNRLKSEKELAKEEQERLEKLELKRQRRMKGFHAVDAKAKHVSADDLGDSFTPAEDNRVLLSYPDTSVWNIMGGEVEHEDNGKHSDEEREGEKDSSDDDDDDVDDDDDNDDDDDDDDDSNCEAESGKEDDASDVESDVSNDEMETDQTRSSPVKQQEQNKKQKIRSEVEETKRELPFTFTAPESYSEFKQLVKDWSYKDQLTIIERIKTCNNPNVTPQNKPKMETFFAILLAYFSELSTMGSEEMKLVDKLSRQLFDIAQYSPVNSAKHMQQIVKDIQERFAENRDRRGGKGMFPDLSELLNLRVVSMLFSASDFKHVVCTPAILLLSQVLAQCPVRCMRDVFRGLFVCDLVFEYVFLSKRIAPEAINFLCGILFMASKKDGHPPQLVLPFKENSKWRDLLKLESDSSGLVVKPLPITKTLGEVTEEESTKDEIRVNTLSHCLSLLSKFLDLYQDLLASFEIFAPVKEHLLRLPIGLYPHSVKELHTSLLSRIKELYDKSLRRRHLTLQTRKPRAIKIYEPKFKEHYEIRHGRRGGNKVANDKQKLRYKYKKEFKGAIREIRKDNQFLAKQKLKEQLERDTERMRKVKEIEHLLSSQQGEVNEMKRIKRKLGKIP
ncbi:nucleolar protein 14-like [Acropora millepora]|uniref:nucleolar protein 14-like n=1 Tax=Acropora millepora TaxID=45264 RepID=UPI001CF579B7|nr:nucleolar protein 14-like [Acropora millepora]